MNSDLLEQDYEIEKEERENSHKILIVGGIATVGIIGAVAGAYYASKARKDAKAAQPMHQAGRNFQEMQAPH